MTELLVCGLVALLFVAIIGWCKAYSDAQDWRAVATTLGDEYDKLFTEHCRRTPVTYGQPRTRGAWLN